MTPVRVEVTSGSAVWFYDLDPGGAAVVLPPAVQPPGPHSVSIRAVVGAAAEAKPPHPIAAEVMMAVARILDGDAEDHVDEAIRLIEDAPGRERRATYVQAAAHLFHAIYDLDRRRTVEVKAVDLRRVLDQVRGAEEWGPDFDEALGNLRTALGSS